MAVSGNISIAWNNLADAGEVSASTFAPLMPPGRLLNHHVARKWRSLTNSDSLVLDLGDVYEMDTAMLLGLNLGSDGVTRVRASEADTSGQDGASFDSGPAAGRVDPRYGSLVVIAESPFTARYVRFDLSQPGAAYLEGGRIGAFLRHEFWFNYDYNWARQWIDRSRRQESRGGQTYVDSAGRYRRLDVTLGVVTESERFGVIEEIDRLNGESTDILLVTKSNSSNLGRDSLWGLVDGLSPVTQPTTARHDGGFVYSKTLSIKERL